MNKYQYSKGYQNSQGGEDPNLSINSKSVGGNGNESFGNSDLRGNSSSDNSRFELGIKNVDGKDGKKKGK